MGKYQKALMENLIKIKIIKICFNIYFFKKSNSVNIFKIKTKLKVINETKNKDLINISLINFV